jgi:hypothetical protein
VPREQWNIVFGRYLLWGVLQSWSDQAAKMKHQGLGHGQQDLLHCSGGSGSRLRCWQAWPLVRLQGKDGPGLPPWLGCFLLMSSHGHPSVCVCA